MCFRTLISALTMNAIFVIIALLATGTLARPVTTINARDTSPHMLSSSEDSATASMPAPDMEGMKIVNGDDTSSLYRAIVARVSFHKKTKFLWLFTTGSEEVSVCSGSLVSQHVVITAAHCVFDGDFDFVRVGVSDFEGNTDDIGVKDHRYLDSYDPTLSMTDATQNDLAFLLLDRTPNVGAVTVGVYRDIVIPSYFAKPDDVPIAPDTVSSPDWDAYATAVMDMCSSTNTCLNAIGAGFGNIVNSATGGAENMDLPSKSRQEDLYAIGYDFGDGSHDGVIITSRKAADQGSMCNGDSGGPLIAVDTPGNNIVMLGVLSAGPVGSKKCIGLDVYASITPHLGAIEMLGDPTVWGDEGVVNILDFPGFTR